jgi:hypothetical protein
LYLATTEPDDKEVIESISSVTNLQIVPVLASRAAIEQALHRYHPVKTEGS